MNDLCEVTILLADGREETHEVGRHILLPWITRMLQAEALDTVNLRDGRVMLVDDNGWESKLLDRGSGVFERVTIRPLKPINAAATKLYRSVCTPGTTHQIAGDVAITLDQHFAPTTSGGLSNHVRAIRTSRQANSGNV